MKLINMMESKIKKSKFIAYYYEIDNIEEVVPILNKLKVEHKKCNHIPYAYRIDNICKKSDDKEPTNTAGSPIYNIIERNNLNNVLIVVVRYYGGIKLGTGGLTRAYSNIAKEAIKKVE